MPRNVLVTGGAGYIGVILSERLLKAGLKVTVIDNLRHGQPSLIHLTRNKHFSFLYGDVRDERTIREALKGVDTIIPLAALVGAPLCEKEPDEAEAVNFKAIRSLNQLRSNEQLLIYPTTNSGYGTKPDGVVCNEETPLEPISWYAQTKAWAEKEILSRPNTISFRLATVFGLSPRMRIDLLVNHFVFQAMTGGTLVVFEKDYRRNYVYIGDVADCFLYSLEHPERLTGNIFNLGLDSGNLTKEELAYRVKAHLPETQIEFSSVGSDPDKRNYTVSSQKLRERGFEARCSLDEGIEELMRGYRLLKHSSFDYH